MKTAACVFCDFQNVEEHSYDAPICRGNHQVVVTGLRHYACPGCGANFANDEQSRHNLVRTQLAFGEAARYVLPEQIKSWRDGLGLTQRDTAKILGGGLNAFSKYENGEVTQSEAMDNLLWIAMRYPGVVADLAYRRGVSLSNTVFMKCGRVMQFTHSSVEKVFYPIHLSSYGDSIWISHHGGITSNEPMRFLDGSWSRRHLSYSLSSVSANDDEFAYPQQV